MKPDDIFRQSTEGASKIKLPGGIFGKVCYVLMTTAGALAAIVGFIRTPEIGYVAISVLLIIVLPTIWRLIRFAEKRPEVAILEGAEFLRYQQIELAQKGVGALPDSPPVPSDSQDALPTPEEIKTAKLPDPEPRDSSKRKLKRSKEG